MFESVEETTKEYLRRLPNIEEWTCRSNIETMADTIERDCDLSTEATNNASKAFEVYNKKSKVHGRITFVLSFIIGFLGFQSYMNFHTAARWPLLIATGIFFIGTLIFIAKGPSTATALKYVNEAKYWTDMASVHLWYNSVLRLAFEKKLYKRVYEDTYKIVTELCKDPKMKEQVEEIKQDLDIDFEYVKKELKGMEK